MNGLLTFDVGMANNVTGHNTLFRNIFILYYISIALFFIFYSYIGQTWPHTSLRSSSCGSRSGGRCLCGQYHPISTPTSSLPNDGPFWRRVWCRGCIPQHCFRRCLAGPIWYTRYSGEAEDSLRPLVFSITRRRGRSDTERLRVDFRRLSKRLYSKGRKKSHF